MKMHVLIESEKKDDVTRVMEVFLEKYLPENSVLMVSCTKSPGQYKATIDVGNPEPAIV
jgi:hypothetical protein